MIDLVTLRTPPGAVPAQRDASDAPAAALAAAWRLDRPLPTPEAGTLESFLFDRYVIDAGTSLSMLRARIRRWPPCNATLTRFDATMLEAARPHRRRHPFFMRNARRSTATYGRPTPSGTEPARYAVEARPSARVRPAPLHIDPTESAPQAVRPPDGYDRRPRSRLGRLSCNSRDMRKTRRPRCKSPVDAEAETFYQRYLAICERVGVEPVSPERARELIRQWDELFAVESTKDEQQ
jgi:hypothetical protein